VSTVTLHYLLRSVDVQLVLATSHHSDAPVLTKHVEKLSENFCLNVY